MKVAIALHHERKDSQVHENFGRCACFGIYDSGTGDLRFVPNADLDQPGHAGLRASHMLIREGVQLVIAGRFGSNVMDYLEKKNIRMVVTELPRSLEDILQTIK